MPPEDRTRITSHDRGSLSRTLCLGRSGPISTPIACCCSPWPAKSKCLEKRRRMSSPETRTATDWIPWPQIVSMRNRLIHAYFDVDQTILWKTATEEIPALLPALRKLIGG